MSRYRETKIIAAVACPLCGAGVGIPCRGFPPGRPQVHPPRKAAWQAAEHPPDYVYQHAGEVMLVAPQSDHALAHLRAMNLSQRHGWEWIGGALRVDHDHMPDLTRRLIAAGWRTAEAI